MLKKLASFVLASLRGSTYCTEYASPLLSLRPRWTTFLNTLWPVQPPLMILSQYVFQGCSKGFSTVCLIRPVTDRPMRLRRCSQVECAAPPLQTGRHAFQSWQSPSGHPTQRHSCIYTNSPLVGRSGGRTLDSIATPCSVKA